MGQISRRHLAIIFPPGIPRRVVETARIGKTQWGRHVVLRKFIINQVGSKKYILSWSSLWIICKDFGISNEDIHENNIFPPIVLLYITEALGASFKQRCHNIFATEAGDTASDEQGVF